MPTENTHIYVDLDVVNNDSFNNKIPLQFSETRNAPFLDGDSGDYYVSIVRFNIQTGLRSLPVFIPKILIGQPDINKTAYVISMRYQHYDPTTSTYRYFTGSANIIYRPTELSAALPAIPTTAQDLSGDYYHVYNYGDIQEMLNKCLESAYANLSSNVDDVASVSDPIASEAKAKIDASIPPIFEFDETTYKFTLNGDVNLFNIDRNNQVHIFFNSPLYQILPFSSFAYNDPVLTYELNLKNLKTLNFRKLSNLATPIDVIYIDQEIAMLSVMNPVAAVVFTSSLLPITNTQTSVPKIFSTGGSNSSSYGQPNIVPIISDFDISVTATNQYRGSLDYAPSAEYRFIDLNNQYNINKIDLNCFWKDHYGNYHTLYLYSGCSAHVKLLFRAKSFNNHNSLSYY